MGNERGGGMKFSDELERLYEAEELNLTDSGPYTQGYLDGIERAGNYIRDLEKIHDGAIEMLKTSIKRLFLR